jgi:RHS repeat-associated protein
MLKKLLRVVSMLLVTVMVMNLLPMESFAEDYRASLAADTITADAIAKAPAMEEITTGRTEYSKEYKLPSGLHMAAVYAEPIHYAQNGKWVDIDNTLKLDSTGKVYTNTAGVWNVCLPQQLTKTNAVSVTKDGYTLSFAPAGELRASGDLQTQSMGLTAQTEALSTTAMTSSSAQVMAIQREETDGLTLEKLQSRLQYTGVFNNTNIVYDLQGSRLKESIVMSSYSSTLRGYRYTLNTDGMIPVVAKSGRIDLYDEKGESIVMTMPAPFLIDNAKNLNFDVQVTLTQSGSQYILTYLLPQQWLASEERSWPVILDPVVEASITLANIEDQTVSSKTYLEPDWGMVQVGYYPSEGITRTFLMYNELPALTSSDVVVSASVNLYLLQTFNDSHEVEVHKVNGPWQEDTITWSNMPQTNDTIEDFAMVQYPGTYTWDVTDIVRGWYAGENTGMMFKMSNAVEAAEQSEWRQFLASEYGEVRPALIINFRNNNGLEGYWDYTSLSAGRAGSGHINSYTGNLVWTRADIGFGGNRMPVSISHIYNANDRSPSPDEDNNSDDSSGNGFGLGYGWRTNYNQLVYQWSEDSYYYVWEDSDGTDHYFRRVSSGTYKDEDGLELTLTTTGSSDSQKYAITDKYGNASYFDNTGRLTKLENNQKVPSSINITYMGEDSRKIATVTDGVGRVYAFTYNSSGLLTRISYRSTGSSEISYVAYGYNTASQLTSITDKDGKTATYTYDSDNRLMTAQDIDGYKLSFQYNTTTAGQPSRVSRAEETDGTAEGGVLTFEYANNQTTIKDHSGNTQILQFNNWGNTLSVQDDQGNAQYARYTFQSIAEEKDNQENKNKVNQLRLSSKLQNTVGNLLKDSSFENSTLWTAVGTTTRSIASGTAYLGNKSLKVVSTASSMTYGVKGTSVSIASGESYTFSAYVKTAESSSAKLTMTPGTGTMKSSDTISGATDWTRLEVTYTNSGSTAVTVTPGLYIKGTAYMDCAQLEKAVTASRYNLIENGDFRHGSYGWTYTALSGTDGVVTASTAAPAYELNSSALQITGGPTTAKSAYQTLPISGSEGDTFVLAGWAKGDAAPLTEDDRAFGLKAILTYTDGDTETFTASFNPDTDSSVNWQYVAIPVVATEAYSSIKISVAYERNVNTALFDGIQLYKEAFGQSYEYDANGNVTKVTDLQGKETEYRYTANNLTAELIDNQAKMTYVYDNYHNVKTATTQEDLVYEFVYDDYGNNTIVSIVSDDVRITSEATYSSDGNRLEITTDALGKETEYSYNADTNVLEWVRYPNDSETTRTNYTYDSMYRVASVAANTNTGTALTASYTYEDDLLTQIETPTTTYDFTYGNFSLRTEVKIGNRSLATYNYQKELEQGENDRKNDLDLLRYGNGDFISYEYDDQGRVTKETFEDGTNVTYKYNNDGYLASVTDSYSGLTTFYYYDFLGRLMSYKVTGYQAHSVSYSYDTLNNLTAVKDSHNGTTSYGYDDDNRVTSVTNGNVSKSYTYDSYGRVSGRIARYGTTQVYSETNTFKAPGATTTSGQLLSQRVSAAGYDVTHSYTYDNNGNILSVSDGTDTTSYVYDSQNQLIRENNQQANKTWTWTYDAAGNILNRKEYAYTTGTLGTPTDTIDYTYGDSDWGDLLTAYDGTAITYDEIGNPLTGRYGTMTWEHGRRLLLLDEWEMGYDTNGMRRERFNIDDGIWYTYYYNSSGQLVRMICETEDWDGYSGYAVLTFTYDASGNPMSANYAVDYYAAGEQMEFTGTFYYVTNAQGDVVALVDETGELLVTYSYDAWGNPVNTEYCDVLTDYGYMEASWFAAHNPLRYRGYVYDTETGLYYLQSRYYDPEVGRFINGDSYISTGLGLVGNNMFAYCINNPTNMYDQTGKYPALVTGEGRLNSLPMRGEPNSSQILYNPDGTIKQKRWYGPEGEPDRDRDNNHSGPGPFPHDHEWKDGKRGTEHLPPSSEYQFSWDPLVGAGLILVCGIGIGAIVVDDAFGVVADDFLIGPLATGVATGWTMIFG